jgi:hypothetical protein
VQVGAAGHFWFTFSSGSSWQKNICGTGSSRNAIPAARDLLSPLDPATGWVGLSVGMGNWNWSWTRIQLVLRCCSRRSFSPTPVHPVHPVPTQNSHCKCSTKVQALTEYNNLLPAPLKLTLNPRPSAIASILYRPLCDYYYYYYYYYCYYYYCSRCFTPLPLWSPRRVLSAGPWSCFQLSSPQCPLPSLINPCPRRLSTMFDQPGL